MRSEIDSDEERRKQIATVVFGAYPAQRRTGQEIAGYAMHLVGCNLVALGRAAMVVTDHFQKFPPNAAELKELARRLDRSSRPKQAANADGFDGAPSVALSPENPFEQLARKWESEPNFDPQTRAAELESLIGRHPVAKEINGGNCEFEIAATGGSR